MVAIKIFEYRVPFLSGVGRRYAHSIVSTKQVMHDAPMSLARGDGDVIDVKLKGSTYQATIVGAGKYLCFMAGLSLVAPPLPPSASHLVP